MDNESSVAKWEYKTMQVDTGRSGIFVQAQIDQDELGRKLNECGESGWELVSASPLNVGGHTARIIVIFKRQRGG